MTSRPERVVVIGASGFGRECLDVLEAVRAAGSALDILGVVDDAPSAVNLERLRARSIPHLGSLDEWVSSADRDVRYVLGIGSPQVRRTLVGQLDAAGFRSMTAIHPSAVIGSVCDFADGVVICSGAVISTNVRLGRHVHVNPNATIGHDTVLGDFVSVNPGAVISGEVIIEPDVLVGAAAIVLQGLTVKDCSTIGAGAVVTKNIPGGVVVKGVPGGW